MAKDRLAGGVPADNDGRERALEDEFLPITTEEKERWRRR